MAAIRWNNVGQSDQSNSIDSIGRAFDRVSRGFDSIKGVVGQVQNEIKQDNTAQVKALIGSQKDLTTFDQSLQGVTGQNLLDNYGRGIDADAVLNTQNQQRSFLEAEAKSEISENLVAAQQTGDFSKVDSLLNKYAPVMKAEDVMAARNVAGNEFEASTLLKQLELGQTDEVIAAAQNSTNPQAGAILKQAMQRKDSETLLAQIPDITSMEQQLRTGRITASDAMAQIMDRFKDDPQFFVRNGDTLQRWASSFANAEAESSNLNDVERAGLENYNASEDLRLNDLKASQERQLAEFKANGAKFGNAFTIASLYTDPTNVEASKAIFTDFINKVVPDQKQQQKIRKYLDNYAGEDPAVLHAALDKLGAGTLNGIIWETFDKKRFENTLKNVRSDVTNARRHMEQTFILESNLQRQFNEESLASMQRRQAAVSQFARGSGVAPTGLVSRDEIERNLLGIRSASSNESDTDTGEEEEEKKEVNPLDAAPTQNRKIKPRSLPNTLGRLTSGNLSSDLQTIVESTSLGDYKAMPGEEKVLLIERLAQELDLDKIVVRNNLETILSRGKTKKQTSKEKARELLENMERSQQINTANREARNSVGGRGVMFNWQESLNNLNN